MAARGEDVPPGLGRQARLCGRSAEMDTPWSRGTPESTWISRQLGMLFGMVEADARRVSMTTLTKLSRAAAPSDPP